MMEEMVSVKAQLQVHMDLYIASIEQFKKDQWAVMRWPSWLLRNSRYDMETVLDMFVMELEDDPGILGFRLHRPRWSSPNYGHDMEADLNANREQWHAEWGTDGWQHHEFIRVFTLNIENIVRRVIEEEARGGKRLGLFTRVSKKPGVDSRMSWIMDFIRNLKVKHQKEFKAKYPDP